MLSVLPLIFYKDSTNRRQYKTNSFVFIVEVQSILFKDSTNRRQYKINLFVFSVEMQFGKQVKKSFEKQVKKVCLDKWQSIFR